MWELGVPLIEIVVRTTIIYFVFLLLLRLSGKRQLGQFTLFDIALVLLAANALQPAMTGPDQSVTGGVIIVVTIFALNHVVAEARVRIPVVKRLLEPQRRSSDAMASGWRRLSNSRASMKGTLKPHSGSTALNGSTR